MTQGRSEAEDLDLDLPPIDGDDDRGGKLRDEGRLREQEDDLDPEGWISEETDRAPATDGAGSVDFDDTDAVIEDGEDDVPRDTLTDLNESSFPADLLDLPDRADDATDAVGMTDDTADELGAKGAGLDEASPRDDGPAGTAEDPADLIDERSFPSLGDAQIRGEGISDERAWSPLDSRDLEAPRPALHRAAVAPRSSVTAPCRSLAVHGTGVVAAGPGVLCVADEGASPQVLPFSLDLWALVSFGNALVGASGNGGLWARAARSGTKSPRVRRSEARATDAPASSCASGWSSLGRLAVTPTALAAGRDALWVKTGPAVWRVPWPVAMTADLAEGSETWNLPKVPVWAAGARALSASYGRVVVWREEGIAWMGPEGQIAHVERPPSAAERTFDPRGVEDLTFCAGGRGDALFLATRIGAWVSRDRGKTFIKLPLFGARAAVFAGETQASSLFVWARSDADPRAPEAIFEDTGHEVLRVLDIPLAAAPESAGMPNVESVALVWDPTGDRVWAAWGGGLFAWETVKAH